MSLKNCLALLFVLAFLSFLVQSDFGNVNVNKISSSLLLQERINSFRDSLNVFKKPKIELHISNIYKREEFRHKSLISGVVTGIICGLGVSGCLMAIDGIKKILNNEN